MPVTSQTIDHRLSPSSVSQFPPRLRHITRAPHGSALPSPIQFESKSALNKPNLPPITVGDFTAAKGNSATNPLPTRDMFHLQMIDHESPNTQFTYSTTSSSTVQDSPCYLEQGQPLRTDFGFQLPVNKAFPDWWNTNSLPSTMLVPVMNDLWDPNEVTRSFDRDATAMEHLPWRLENSFK